MLAVEQRRAQEKWRGKEVETKKANSLLRLGTKQP